MKTKWLHHSMMSMEEFPLSTEQQMTYSLQIFFHTICLKSNYIYVVCWTQHNCGFVGQDCMQDNSYAKEMELTIYYLLWTHLYTQENHNSRNVLLKTLSWFSFFKDFIQWIFHFKWTLKILSYFLSMNDLPLVCQTVLLSSKTMKIFCIRPITRWCLPQ